jgi:hypothetical protein
MSGGSYDYAYHRINDLAIEVRKWANTENLSPEAKALRLRFAEHLDLVSEAAHALEWVDRIFDMDAILKWAQEREQFFDGDPQHPGPNSKFRAMRKAQTVARHRERLSEKYAGKLGVTEALLDRWAKKGWR